MKPPEVFALGSPTVGWACGCSRRGASHYRNNQPCQDAFALWSGAIRGSPRLVAAVADGHGDARHDLSDVGAALAVQVAVSELCSFHVGHADPPDAQMRRDFKSDCPRIISRRWREAVRSDASERCPTVIAPSSAPQELATELADESPLFRRYGTTLLTALLTPETLCVAQLGDGDIVWLRPDGECERPFPVELAIGTETDSLCSPNAQVCWKTATLDRRAGGLLLLTTDGLPNSFADDTAFDQFVGSLRQRIHDHGFGGVADALPAWLDHYSDQGSGDDMTLVIIEVPPIDEHSNPPGEQ